jgi:hypothetical protein
MIGGLTRKASGVADRGHEFVMNHGAVMGHDWAFCGQI